MDLFNIAAKLTLDSSKFDEGLDKSEDKAKGFGSAIGGAGKVAAGLGAAVVGASAALYGMSSKSAATSDRIDKMSQKLGISRKTFQEFDFIASQSGTSVEVLKGGMKTLTKQMTSAQSGTKKSKEAFEKLGVSVTDANGNMRDQEEVLFDTITALQNMEDGTEKAALASQVLGKAGTEMMPLLNGAAGSMEEMRQQAHDLGLVLEDDVIDAGVKFTDTADQLKRSFDTIVTKVGAQVMPVVQGAMDFVIQHMPEIQAVVSKVFGYLEGFISWVGTIGTKYIMPALTGIIDFVKGVFSGDFKGAWENLKGAFQNIWSGLSGWFSGIWEDVKGAVTSVDWAQVGSDILEKIKTALGAIVEWATEWYNSLADAINGISWEDVGNTIWNGIEAAFNGVFSFFQTIFGDAKTGVENGIDWLGLGTAIWEYIKAAFGAVSTTFLTIFSRAKETISNIHWLEMAKAIWDKIVEGLGDIVGNLKEMFENAKAKLDEISWVEVGTAIWTAIKNGLSTLAGGLMGLFIGGKNSVKNNIDWAGLGSSIWELIKSAFLGIAGIFKGLFEGAVTAIKNIEWAELGSAIWGLIKSAFGAVGTFFLGKFSSAKTTIQNIRWGDMAQAVWGFIKGAFNGVGNFFHSTFVSAKSLIQNIPWGTMAMTVKGFITSKFENIAGWFHDKFLEAKNKLLSINWSEVGSKIFNAIGGWITSLESKLNGLGAKIRSALGMAKQPISLGGEYKDPITGLDAYTSFASAYQNPVMFTRPTVLSTPSGLKRFGDGVGGEIVLSDRRLREITGSEATVSALNALIGLVYDIGTAMPDNMAYAVSQVGLKIDGREFGRLVRRV